MGACGAPAWGQGAPDIAWIASGHSREVNAVTFSPDGSLVASASDDFTVKLWRAADGSLIRTLNGHRQDVQSVTFSPDGALLFTGGKDDTIRIWRVADGASLQTFEEGSSPAGYSFQPRHALALSPDGTLIATARTIQSSTEVIGIIQVRSATNGVVLREFGRSNVEMRALAFSPDGAWLVSGENTGISLWRLADSERVVLSPGQGFFIDSVTFSPDGTLIAGGAQDGSIRLWRMADRTLERVLTGHSALVRSVAFSPEGTRLASAGFDRTLRLWKVADGTQSWSQTGQDDFRAVTFSPNGDFLVSGNKDDSVALWLAVGGQWARTFTAHAAPVTTVEFSPDERFLVSWAGGTDDRTVKVWDCSSGALKWSAKVCSYNGPVAISPDSTRLAVTDAASAATRIYSLADGQLGPILGTPTDIVTSLAFSPDGTLLAIGTYDWQIQLWRWSDGSLLRTLRHYYGAPGKLAFTADGDYLISATQATAPANWRSIRFWRLSDGEQVMTLPADSFSMPLDQDCLVSIKKGSPDLMSFLRWSNEQLVMTPPGMFGVQGFLSASPEWSYAVSHTRNYLRFWRLADQAVVQSYDQEITDVSSFSFSPSGRLFAYGRADASLVLARNHYGVATPSNQPPVILVQPRSQTLRTGEEMTLWTRTAGGGPLDFQWRLNDSPLAGKTNFNLALGPAELADAGSYVVTVRNSFGSVTSQVAKITVIAAPRITRQPESQIADVGATVTLSVEAAGAESYTYQWLFNGHAIVGGTSAILNLPNLQVDQTGDYSVVVTGAIGSTTSIPARLTIQSPFQQLWQTPYSEWSQLASFTPDGTQLILQTSYGMRSIATSNGAALGQFTISNQLTTVPIISPDGAFWVGISGSDLELRRIHDNALVRTLASNRSELTAAFSPDGTLLTSATDLEIQLYRTHDGSSIGAFANVIPFPRFLTFSLDGKYLAAAGNDRDVQVWHTGTREVVCTLGQQFYGATRLALSPNGSMLATGGEDRMIRLWQLPQGRLLATLEGQFAKVDSMAFSREGAFLGALKNGQPEFWRTTDATLLPVSLPPVSAYYGALAFSPKDDLIGYSLNDGTVAVASYPFAAPSLRPSLSIVRPLAGQPITLKFTGEEGRQYSIQASTNLASWVELTNFVSTVATNAIIDPDATAHAARFYRAQQH